MFKNEQIHRKVNEEKERDHSKQTHALSISGKNMEGTSMIKTRETPRPLDWNATYIRARTQHGGKSKKTKKKMMMKMKDHF